MQIHIKLLNVYRKYMPQDAQGSTYNLDVPTGSRIEELLARLPIPSDESQVVLVNGHTPQAGQILEPGDTVAIFPALAGG
jgi:sulfur carrier protein ThiS